MAFKGPVGLFGKPENIEGYEPFAVEDTEKTVCWISEKVLAAFAASPEEEHLFFVEGTGRLRLRFVETGTS
jgi:hypothetical protein